VAEYFPADKLFLIAGPCVLESDELNLRVGEALAKLADRIPGGIIYKASFDKANRSNRGAARGPGLDAGLEALDRVRRATGLPVLTDVHTPEQCAPAAKVVDVLQIPAFLCRQTDLLDAAGATGKPVNGRSSDIAVTERGTFFGYGDLVVDMRSFTRLREACEAPVIFDATHSVQKPGQGPDGASGGAREYVPILALSAIAAGAQGLFLETHPDPDCAPSDGPNMLPLSELGALLDRAVDIWARVNR